MLSPKQPEPCCPQLAQASAQGHAMVRARHEAKLLLAHERLAAPASAFRVHPVKEIRGQVLDLGGVALTAPVLCGLSGITSVAAAACTLGAALEERISMLFRERRRLLAMALDALATETLFRLCDLVYARIRREARRLALQAGPPEHPGDDGLALDTQGTVLALAGVNLEAISANSHGMLRPVKSLSFVAALGPRLPADAFLPRCVRCASREGCRLRPQ